MEHRLQTKDIPADDADVEIAIEVAEILRGRLGARVSSAGGGGEHHVGRARGRVRIVRLQFGFENNDADWLNVLFYNNIVVNVLAVTCLRRRVR